MTRYADNIKMKQTVRPSVSYDEKKCISITCIYRVKNKKIHGIAWLEIV